MEKRPQTDLMISDFMKYIPEEKRENYELTLRKCHFNDESDPMFPIMLFLLFLQDNQDKNLTQLKTEITPIVPVPVQKFSAWRYVFAGLLGVQLVISICCCFLLLKNPAPATQAISPYQSGEIQSMNNYWEQKIVDIEAEKSQDKPNTDDKVVTALTVLIVAAFLIFFVPEVLRGIAELNRPEALPPRQYGRRMKRRPVKVAKVKDESGKKEA